MRKSDFTEIMTAALDEAMAEGRVQAAEELHRITLAAASAMQGCSSCDQFRAGLLELIAGHLEAHRRERSRLRDRFLEVSDGELVVQ